MRLARARGTNDRLPVVRDLRFGFAIRFIRDLGKSWKLSDIRAMAEWLI